MQKNTLEGKAKTKNGIKRLCFCAVCILLEVIFIVSMITRLNEYAEIVNLLTRLLGTILVLALYASDQTSSMKMPWIILILIFPIMGVALYLLIGLNGGTRKMRKRYEKIDSRLFPLIPANRDNLERLRLQLPKAGSISTYIQRNSSYPVYRNTDITYYDEAIKGLHAQLADLAKAEHFIFMEYFIIDRGYMWDSILEVLKQKAAEGVEVRVMYDGMCCLMLLPYHYPQKLEKMGIRCQMFSPIKPVLSTHQNYRDHRKVTVIDGHTAFTGGVNLADEYINRKERFGHWKDTAIMVKGDAVKSFTMMFLQMWDAASPKSKNEENYEQYLVPADYKLPEGYAGNGFVMPYADSPLDEEQVGEQVYLDILNQAKSYVHIITPYLILDDEMKNAMAYAAKRGIDVKIIMPHIPDKKYAYLLARTYYPELIASGVKIYEYEPGFTHAKIFVSDDEKATVGSINLDFRSLYLHFECGTYLYRNSTVADVEKDFEKTLEKCISVTLKDCAQYNWFGIKAGRFLRLIAPLM